MINLEEKLDTILVLDKSRDFYKNWYDRILNFAKISHPGKDKSKYPGEFLELHHILPRSLGGSDGDDNLVLLTTLEHIVIHILLYLIHKEDLQEGKIYGYACWCMITKHGEYTKDRTICKKYINPVILSKIRNEYIFSVSKAVVGFDEDYNVIRIYAKQEDCRKDGFSPSSICEAIKGTYKRAGGYNWDTIENFKISHQEKIDKYLLDLNSGILPELGDIIIRSKYFAAKEGSLSQPSLTPVVCCTKDFDVIREYPSISSTAKDGFSYKHIPSVLKRERGRKTLGGYLWFKTEEFELAHKDKLVKFRKNLENGILPKIAAKSRKEERKVVMLDELSGNLKIYNSLAEVSNDGHTAECVLKSIYGSYGRSGSSYKNFSWYFLGDFRKIYPEKLKEYEQRGDTDTNNP